MDNELTQLAYLQLRNAFYLDFSALVRDYMNAAKDLSGDKSVLLAQLGELSNVYSVSMKSWDTLERPDITTDSTYSRFSTLAKALARRDATCVYINKCLAFRRNPTGEWILIDITSDTGE